METFCGFPTLWTSGVDKSNRMGRLSGDVLDRTHYLWVVKITNRRSVFSTCKTSRYIHTNLDICESVSYCKIFCYE